LLEDTSKVKEDVSRVLMNDNLILKEEVNELSDTLKTMNMLRDPVEKET
jgi:hypothetical protein